MDLKDSFDKICGAVKNLPIVNKYTLEQINADPETFVNDVDKIAEEPLNSVKDVIKGFSLNSVINAGKEFFNVK
jgi:hypothetical protein